MYSQSSVCVELYSVYNEVLIVMCVWQALRIVYRASLESLKKA